MKYGRIWAIAGLAILVTGCASSPHSHRMAGTPSPPPTATPAGPADAAGPASTTTTAQAASVRGGIDHRQYFDQRRKRYYFYDPTRRAYFWEDGSPKT